MGSFSDFEREKTGRNVGKIETHLAEKLVKAKWGEYKLKELFYVLTPKKRFDANKVQVFEQGLYPYVVRTALNNGIKGFIEEDLAYLNEGNTISFGQDTATMFYQSVPYFTGDKIKVLKPKYSEFNSKNSQFLLSIMSKSFSKFSWGSSSFSTEIIENQPIQLPTQNGKIDFAFMENFIAELKALRVAELHAYLQVTGLSNYTLTDDEQAALNAIKTAKWQSFNVVDVFDVKNTFNILSRDIVENSGNVPYLSASRENNAVSSYISYDESFLDRGNCIFIGGKTFVVTYQEQDFYSNDSHNLCLYLKETEKLNKLNQFFMISCLEKGLSHQYSWGNSISNKKIQKDQFLLPVKDGKIDYEFMETFISAIQKLVIKDVVQWADKQIEATEQVILN